MKFKSLIVVASFIPLSAFAASRTFTTSTGAIFTQTQGPGSFGTVWKDPSGVIWSGYQGEARCSEDLPKQGAIPANITAVELCKNVGGVLPSAEDYNRLVSYFEHQGTLLTERGSSQLHQLFPDMSAHDWFWTSSADPHDMTSGAVFNTVVGYVALVYTRDNVDYRFPRNTPYSVRCTAR